MPERSRIHAAIDELLQALDEYRRAPVEEEFVRVRDLPFEAKARAELVSSGRLRTVRLGRETWTKRSWVSAAVESLPPAHAVDDQGDELLAAARRKAARRCA